MINTNILRTLNSLTTPWDFVSNYYIPARFPAIQLTDEKTKEVLDHVIMAMTMLGSIQPKEGFTGYTSTLNSLMVADKHSAKGNPEGFLLTFEGCFKLLLNEDIWTYVKGVSMYFLPEPKEKAQDFTSN